MGWIGGTVDRQDRRAVGLRDRALIAAMVYSFARVSAIIHMKVEDYYAGGKRWRLRLHEKGGKFHEAPAHHKAEGYLDAYIQAAGIAGDEKGPLFQRIGIADALRYGLYKQAEKV